jgi:hypothetical protein
MIPIEHNDVDIKPLLSWKRKFEITSATGEVITTVYMRLVGDADMNRARVAALRNSAELRKKLRNHESDEYIAFTPDMDELIEEQLINLVVVFSMRGLTSEAIKKLKLQVPRQPKSDAGTEAFEQYQKELDEFPEKRNVELKKILERFVVKQKKELSTMDKKTLYDKYIRVMSNELCEQELIKTFKEQVTYYGSFKDEELKIKFFDSFEDFQNLDPYLKSQFISTYSELEMTSDDLKKLRGAMQS